MALETRVVEIDGKLIREIKINSFATKRTALTPDEIAEHRAKSVPVKKVSLPDDTAKGATTPILEHDPLSAPPIPKEEGAESGKEPAVKKEVPGIILGGPKS